MPTHLLHSGNEQVIIFLGAIAVAVLIRFWRIVLTGFALMLIVAALIVFSVILDLHVVHGVATYLRNLVHEITGLTMSQAVPRRFHAGGVRPFLVTARAPRGPTRGRIPGPPRAGGRPWSGGLPWAPRRAGRS